MDSNLHNVNSIKLNGSARFVEKIHVKQVLDIKNGHEIYPATVWMMLC